MGHAASADICFRGNEEVDDVDKRQERWPEWAEWHQRVVGVDGVVRFLGNAEAL